MNDYYNDVELSLQETVDAIREGQKKKYFHEKNKSYWEKQESLKGKTKMISYESRDQTHPEDLSSSK
ncbi:MAG TPA: hypothetical protein VLF20_02725 [Patescibacteria group bacterium]|nr:hypothetical protein [Patescibacteria group bacterium]